MKGDQIDGRSIAALRVLKGMTQRQLAVSLNRSQTWMSFVESGKLSPQVREQEKIRDVLSPEVAWFPSF